MPLNNSVVLISMVPLVQGISKANAFPVFSQCSSTMTLPRGRKRSGHFPDDEPPKRSGHWPDDEPDEDPRHVYPIGPGQSCTLCGRQWRGGTCGTLRRHYCNLRGPILMCDLCWKAGQIVTTIMELGANMPAGAWRRTSQLFDMVLWMLSLIQAIMDRSPPQSV